MIYDKDFQYNREVLDKIDILSFVHQWDEPHDIMEIIQDAYEDHELPIELDELIEGPILSGYVFNCMSTDDFMDYLTERYGTRFDSEITYWVTFKGEE